MTWVTSPLPFSFYRGARNGLGVTMHISDLIGPERVIINLRVRDKDHLLQRLSDLAAPVAGVDADGIFRALRAREELGSTGLGRGFALPHARVDGIKSLLGMFVRLSRPLEFQAIDEKPVDLVFLLLIPPDNSKDHLAALAAISRQLRDGSASQGLRNAGDAETAYRLLTLG
jgi:nitrogen PTS system EIIA component